MSPPVRVDQDFKSHRREMSGALNRALENRRSYLGFLLGMAATLVVVLGALGWTLVHAGVLTF